MKKTKNADDKNKKFVNYCRQNKDTGISDYRKKNPELKLKLNR